MNNLENKDILSDNVLSGIDYILEKCPDVIFGGSIALNAVGLLNRKISDIDLFFPLGTEIKIIAGLHNDDLMVQVSEPATDTNGNKTFYVGDVDTDNNATSGTEEFAGDIDDLRIFRYALNTTQIRNLYNENATTRFGPQSGTP